VATKLLKLILAVNNQIPMRTFTSANWTNNTVVIMLKTLAEKGSLVISGNNSDVTLG